MKFLWPLSLVVVLSFSTAGQQVPIRKEERVAGEASRQVADRPADFFGPFRINGEKPRGFENFDFFVLGYGDERDAAKDNREALVPDRQGAVAVRGEAVTVKGTPLGFEWVRLVEAGPVTHFFRDGAQTRIARAQPVKLSFKTVEAKGVRYGFSGEYLDEALEENGGLTHLRGKLSKFKHGALVAEQQIGFVRLDHTTLSGEEAEPGSSDPPPSTEPEDQSRER